jgi:methyl-accepting chemotaxis protein
MAEQEKEERKPRRLARIGGLVLIILSIIILVLNVAGIVGAWAVNEPLTKGVVGILEPVEQTLDLAGDLLDRISAGVERARGVVSTIDAAAELLGDNIEENRPLLNLISKALGDELGPVVENVGEIVSTARAAATTIQNALEIVDGLPFVSLGEDGLESTRIEKMANRISDVATSLEELDTSVQERRSEATEEIVGRITSRTAEISAFLDDLQSEVEGYRAQITDLQERVAILKARVPLWIDLGSIGLTLLFVWLGLSQVSIFIHGWSFFTGQDLLARWR